MRYAKETFTLLVVMLVVVAVLLVVAYRPRPEAPGDETPLEHELGADPPPELRRP